MSMLKTRNIVFDILSKNKSSRDENVYLYHFYLLRIGIEPANCSVHELLVGIKEGKIKSFDSISRASRLVQENHPQLRGKNWDKRQRKAVKVKEEVLELKNGKGYTP